MIYLEREDLIRLAALLERAEVAFEAAARYWGDGIDADMARVDALEAIMVARDIRNLVGKE